MTVIFVEDNSPEAAEYDSAYLYFDARDPDHMREVLSGLEERARQGATDRTLFFAIEVLRRELARSESQRQAGSPLRDWFTRWVRRALALGKG